VGVGGRGGDREGVMGIWKDRGRKGGEGGVVGKSGRWGGMRGRVSGKDGRGGGS